MSRILQAYDELTRSSSTEEELTEEELRKKILV